MHGLLPPALELLPLGFLLALSFVTSCMAVSIGVGGGLVLLIGMLSVLPPVIAFPIQSLVQLGSSVGRALLMRRSVRVPIVRRFGVGSFVGAVIGTLLFVPLPSDLLKLGLAMLIFWVLWADEIRRRRAGGRRRYFSRRVHRRRRTTHKKIVRFEWVGALSAFGAMFIGATGPLVSAYFARIKADRREIVATMAVCLVFLNSVKVAGFLWLGFGIASWLTLIVSMVITGYLGTLVGAVILKRFSDDFFMRLYRIALSVVALYLSLNSALALAVKTG